MKSTIFRSTITFGARHYNSALSLWLSVDPLSDKYPSLSPYTYCANNPVRLVDGDGREIVDENGKCCYDSQKGCWLENASINTKRIGDAMMATEKGKEVFTSMAESNVKIQLILSDKKVISKNRDGSWHIEFGMFECQTFRDNVGKEHMTRGFITVYLGTIEEFVKNKDLYAFNSDSPHFILSKNKYGFSIDEIIGAVGGHEGGHATQENLDLRNSGAALDDYEAVPRQNEKSIYEELKVLHTR